MFMPRGSRICTNGFTRGLRAGRCTPWRALVVIALGLGVVGVPESGAELVVLTDGRYIKVSSFERQGDRMRLTLPAARDASTVTCGPPRRCRIQGLDAQTWWPAAALRPAGWSRLRPDRRH